MSSDYVVIVAGGKGLRMGGDMPKQFLPLGGRPVLMHTLERFHECYPRMNIILVLPHDQQPMWREMCREHAFDVAHTIVDGGATRYESSQNGVAAIPDDANGVVGIHDGVRPLVSVDVIRRCYDAARRTGAAIPVLPVIDTIRYVAAEGGEHNVQRADYRIVQTPQAFDIQLVKRAFRQPYDEGFTDDASVVERAGSKVAMVEGNRENIKLTTPYDLRIAECFLEK